MEIEAATVKTAVQTLFLCMHEHGLEETGLHLNLGLLRLLQSWHVLLKHWQTEAATKFVIKLSKNML